MNTQVLKIVLESIKIHIYGVVTVSQNPLLPEQLFFWLLIVVI